MDDELKELFMAFPIVSAICNASGYSLEEMYYLSDEKIMNQSVQLICEISDLIEQGYTYDEINEAIENTKFEELDLNEEEKSFLRRDAKKTLKIKYKQKGDKNNE